MNENEREKPDLSIAEVSPLPPEDAIEELSDVALRILVGAEISEGQHFNPRLVRLNLGGIQQVLHINDLNIAKWAADTAYREHITPGRLELMIRSLPYMLECRKWIRKLLVNHYSKQDKDLRVVFLRGDNAGCGYWRMKLPGEFIRDEENGVSLHISDVEINYETLLQYDVIVVERLFEFEKYYILETLKKAGKKIVYEIDDDVFSLEAHNPAARFYNRFDSQLCIRHCLNLADAVMVTTERLAKALNIEDKAIIYPNSLDWDMLFYLGTNKDKERTNKRIFWAGSNTHNEDFKVCISSLLQIMAEREDVEFWIAGSCPPIIRETFQAFMDRLVLIPGMHTEGYFHFLRNNLDVDIGIIPLANSVFNHSKSVCKGLEYTLARIPIIASGFPPYSDIYEHGADAMLCQTEEDWYNSINQLLENDAMREELIKEARKKAAAKFNLRTNAAKLAEDLKMVGEDIVANRIAQKNLQPEDPEVVPVS